MWAPSWSWIVAANLILGVNQGLCWSTTVIMKIDLAGPKQRGFAMGLNEFAGYIAVAVAAYFSAMVAGQYGLRPAPFYMGVVFSIAGFLISLLFVKETLSFTNIESNGSVPTTANLSAGIPSEKLQTSPKNSFKQIFYLSSWKDKNLFSCSQAGLVNNLNDGMGWGLFPLFFASLGFSIGKIGLLAALYLGTWGVLQLGTAALSDRLGGNRMIGFG